jgi:molecular chaperone DnaJ
MADLYGVLGLRPDAGAEEIKRAYRRKAREHHPDAGGDEERFKELNHAYEVLSDPERRARYDRFGDDGTPQARGAGDPFGFGAGFGGGIGDVIDAFFGAGFGGGGGGFGGAPQRERVGRDVLVGVDLTLDEVLTGVTRRVKVEVASSCDTCAGNGSADGSAPTRCGTCGGSGRVQRMVRTPLGSMATASACGVCAGTGRSVADACRDCRGEGRRMQRRELEVEIPAGLEDGDRIPQRGQGEAGRQGAPAGDLYVQVQVAPHPFLVRDGRSLHTRVNVPLTTALLGGRLRVPSIGGEEHDVEVPAGVQPGQVLLVTRAGLPVRGGGRRGDLHLHVDVAVPQRLGRRERDLVRQWADQRGEDPDGGGVAEVRRP